MAAKHDMTEEEMALAEKHLDEVPPESDPEIDALVMETLGRVADKWTMLLIEELTEGGVMRFSQLSRQIPDISQKMLTQTLRSMEREGLVTRTVYPVVPPKVEYELTDLGVSLARAFCGVWVWAERYQKEIREAREAFDARQDG